MERYKDLSFLHGQAAVEQNFSLGNAFLNDNMSEDSIKQKKLLRITW